MNYGFLDESGDVAYTAEAGRTLVVVVVVVQQPEKLRKAVTKTRKALGKGARNLPELKAADSDPRLIKKLLTHAVNIGFDAVGVVIDKSKFPEPEDPEDLYREACAVAVREVLVQSAPLTVTLDRRYTKWLLREKLDRALAAGVEDLGVTLAIYHADSQQEYGLQVADAISWALFQKYERQDEMFWEIIRARVAVLHRP